MITYVNDVFVSNEATALYAGKISALANANKSQIANVGKIAIVDMADPDTAVGSVPATASQIKIGLITDKVSTIIGRDGSVKYTPVINWSNVINKGSIKSMTLTPWADDVDEKIEVDFSATGTQFKQKIAAAGHSIVFRIIYKDMNTRFRKWTESYEYVTVEGDNEKKVAVAIAKLIKKDASRARVIVDDSTTATTGKFTITAMKYDDDDSVNALSPAATVRFSAAAWVAYGDEAGIAGLGWNHRLPIPGLKITKTPGSIYTASPKYVRDREAAALGYDGIINRGEGTLRDVNLPSLNVKLDGQYDSLTIMFENMYRTADDLHRLTKQSIEIYPKKGEGAKINTALSAFAA